MIVRFGQIDGCIDDALSTLDMGGCGTTRGASSAPAEPERTGLQSIGQRDRQPSGLGAPFGRQWYSVRNDDQSRHRSAPPHYVRPRARMTARTKLTEPW